MGMHIDLLGRFGIRPALNHAETEYLRAFAVAGFDADGDDRHAVHDHPFLEVALRRSAVERAVPPPEAEPRMGCGWIPCVQGCCLSWTGVEKFYQPGDWLAFLVEHLLAPAARERASGSPALKGFTFDHVVDGIAAATCYETQETWLVVARSNEVSEVLLSRGECEEGFWPRLPFAEALDPLDESSYRTAGLPLRARTRVDPWDGR